jgi:TPR repeat protein
MARLLNPASIASLLGIALLAIATGAGNAPAHAQSADALLCDRIAADPTDPDKPPEVKGTITIAPADIATAIKFCKRASAASRRALFELGRAYAAKEQWQNALAAYRKAADKGSTAAMVELGTILSTGSGVAKDLDQARSLFARAAEAGNTMGATKLAALTASGGAPSDPATARALLAKAAETNSAEAQYQLGVMMTEGAGGPKDEAGARALFEKAAAQNHPEALDWLGSFAEQGRGGPQDAAAAKAYYERAAALGNEDAKAALERLKCPLVLKDKRGSVVTNLCF